MNKWSNPEAWKGYLSLLLSSTFGLQKFTEFNWDSNFVCEHLEYRSILQRCTFWLTYRKEHPFLLTKQLQVLVESQKAWIVNYLLFWVFIVEDFWAWPNTNTERYFLLCANIETMQCKYCYMSMDFIPFQTAHIYDT